MTEELPPPPAGNNPKWMTAYPTFNQRLFAGVLDVGLLFFLLQDLFYYIGRLLYRDATPLQRDGEPPEIALRHVGERFFNPDFFIPWLLNNVVQVGMIGILIIGCWISFQTTPGKWILGMKLADSETYEAPTLGQCIRRYLGYLVSLPVVFAGLIAMNFNHRKRAWHDLIGGTVVIYFREPNPFKYFWGRYKAWEKEL